MLSKQIVMAHQKKHSGFRNSWKDYFSFNNRVRRGLIVLFGLITLEIAVLFYLRYIPSSSGAIDITKFKKEIDDFYGSGIAGKAPEKGDGDSSDTYKKGTSYERRNENPNRKAAELFSFNPNNLPRTEWKRLGFSDRQIQSIRNYEEKGGKFRTKEDVRKMYAIKVDEFSRIEPYISIPDTEKKKSGLSFTHERKHILVVDIGTADQVELEKLPMVGEFLAAKISSYREKLGGYYSINQVKEIRGMRDSTYLVIVPHLFLKDSTNLRRINLNTADYDELNRHPYIDNTLARLIISFRTQHDKFSEVDDLRKVALVDAELYRKIAPYLKVE